MRSCCFWKPRCLIGPTRTHPHVQDVDQHAERRAFFRSSARFISLSNAASASARALDSASLSLLLAPPTVVFIPPLFFFFFFLFFPPPPPPPPPPPLLLLLPGFVTAGGGGSGAGEGFGLVPSVAFAVLGDGNGVPLCLPQEKDKRIMHAWAGRDPYQRAGRACLESDEATYLI